MDGSTNEIAHRSPAASSSAHRRLHARPCCPKRFGARSGKTKHMIVKHPSADTRGSFVSANTRATKAAFECDQCQDVRFLYRNDLMRHHERDHGFVARRSTLQFLSRTAFESWRERQEQQQVRFVPAAGKKELSSINLHGSRSYLVCSSKPASSAYRQSHLTKQGLPCFANMVVAEDSRTGIVTVHYQESHYGHQTEPPCLLPFEQRAVIKKLSQSVSENIFTEAHSTRQDLLCFPTSRHIDGISVNFGSGKGPEQPFGGTGYPAPSLDDHSYYVIPSVPEPDVDLAVAPSTTNCSALTLFATDPRSANETVFFSSPGPAISSSVVPTTLSSWHKTDAPSLAASTFLMTSAPGFAVSPLATARLASTSLVTASRSAALSSASRHVTSATTLSDRVAAPDANVYNSPVVSVPRLGSADCMDLASLPTDARSVDEAVHLLASSALKSLEAPARVSSVQVAAPSYLSPDEQHCIVELMPWPQAESVVAPSRTDRSAADSRSSAEALLLSIGSPSDLATVDSAADAAAHASHANCVSADVANAVETDFICLSSSSDDECSMSTDGSDEETEKVSKQDRMRVTTLTKTFVALIQRIINKDWIDAQGGDVLLQQCGEMHKLLNAYPDKEMPIFPCEPAKGRPQPSRPDEHDCGPHRGKP